MPLCSYCEVIVQLLLLFSYCVVIVIVAMISCVVIMCCYAILCYDECNIVVWWIWPTRCRPTETKPDETRYYQMQSGRICPMVSLSAHRGLMPVPPFPVNIMNDMMFTVFIVGKQEIFILQ